MRTSRVVALALVVGTFFVAQEVLTDLASGNRVSFAKDVMVVLLFWVAWALLTPAVLAASRRWPLDAKPAWRTLLVHSVVATLLATSQNLITISLRSVARYVRGDVGAIDAVRLTANPTAFTWGVFTGAFCYAVIVVVYSTVRFRALYSDERLRALALAAELSQSKLDTLRSQLRPHFLFNTLNAISVLVTEDAAKAREMILRLSMLLRRSLDEVAHEVPLRQEMAFVSDYLDIQRGRFGDQLAVNVAIDASVMDARVPVFLLQPLLENAIEHGKADDRRTTVTLSASRTGDTLCIMLADDGPGLAGGTPVRQGVGLGNTRARLLHMYGPNASVELVPSNGGITRTGARVEVRLPFRMSPA